jgi:L-methionine (R)-S-oxide reductase
MDDAKSVLIKLQDLSQFLSTGSLEESLEQQARMTAALVDADSCSIMLLNTDGGADGPPRMGVSAHFGPLPPAAWRTTTAPGEGIAGVVLAAGKSLLVEDILDSPFAHLARRADDPRRSLMLAPITIDGKTVGMVNVCARHDSGPFTEVQLHMLDVIALVIGKSVQVMQLQAILNSRFVQLALLQEVQGRVGTDLASTAYQNPDQVARILAKSLFREMTRAGFGSAQIIGAATEIIDQLNGSLQRLSVHAARQESQQARP